MRCIFYFAILLFLVFNCSSETDVQKLESEPMLTDVLTLELSFGDEKTIVKDEFLLARPDFMVVNDDGDIYVVDENRVKVFNKNGKEKAIIGRPGQGPGEFEVVCGITISSTGFLTVIDNRQYLHIFSPNYDFLDKINIQFSHILKDFFYERELSSNSPIQKAYSIDATKRIIGYSTLKIDDIERISEGIVFDCPDTLIEVAYYDVEGRFKLYQRSSEVIVHYKTPFSGEFCWDILPDNRVVYTDTDIDKSNYPENTYYILHIKSYDTFETTQISYSYVPVETPYTAKNNNYYPPLQGLLTDRNFIFAFTYLKNDEGEFLVDLFDANTCEHISSAYFPFVPTEMELQLNQLACKIIKNGYAYKFNDWRKNDEFPKVEKYRIDPAVYGK